ncbi:MAG: anti-sigma factor [Chloroflexi bacterium]|nr:anti-sigma factor [Chloroflexota bacterium]
MIENQDHGRLFESLPAYVLGALEEQERVEIEDHLESCPQCASEYDDLAEAGTILALNVPPREPPSELRTRLLDAIISDEEMTVVRDSSPIELLPEKRSSRRFGWVTGFQIRYATAAAIMIGVFAVSVSTLLSNGTLDERVEELESQASSEATVVSSIASTVMDVSMESEEPSTTIETVSRLAIANEHLQEALQTSVEMQKAASQPTARTALLRKTDGTGNTSGTLVAGHETLTRGMMMIQGLDPPPPGYVYQIWMNIGGVPRNLGTFHVNEMGYVFVEMSVPLFNAKTLVGAVTIEPGGGSMRPTGVEILRLSAP